MSVFAPELVDFHLSAADKQEAVLKMANLVVRAGRGNNVEQIVKDVMARDEMGTPQVDGVAIPHARSNAVTQSTVVVARTAGVKFDPDEEPADVLFMILVPDGESNEHIEILSGLARRLMDPEFTNTLRTTNDANQLVDLLSKGQE